MKRIFAAMVCLLLVPQLTSCQQDEAVDEIPPLALSEDGEEGSAYEAFDPALGKSDGLSFTNKPLNFEAACEPGDTLTIAAVGDILIHGRLQKQALREDNGFISLWSGIEDMLQDADITYANLEGPTATGVNARGRSVTDPGAVFDNYVYSSYPQFNYHTSLLQDLQASGVDVVSTANNHSLDRRSLGVDRTLEALDAVGMPYTGTRRRDDDASAWYTTTNAKGFKIAWLACTYGTNGLPDNHHQVLWCYKDTDLILDEVRSLSKDESIDAVIVTPHWGLEYHANPNLKQSNLAHKFLEAGATAVIGSHPHVLQPWEKYVTEDGRETLVMYSLGNFISGQRQIARRSTLLLRFGLVRGEDGVTKVSGARYVPLYMSTKSNGFLTLEAVDRVQKHGDSRALTVNMFGLWNLDVPGAKVDIVPQCNPEWKAPHPHDGWIGGSCTAETDSNEESVCGDALCDGNYPDGLCTTSCERYCPDLRGRAGTFCVQDVFAEGGICALQCSEDDDCRPGYSCQEMGRYKEAATVRKVCFPL